MLKVCEQLHKTSCLYVIIGTAMLYALFFNLYPYSGNASSQTTIPETNSPILQSSVDVTTTITPKPGT